LQAGGGVQRRCQTNARRALQACVAPTAEIQGKCLYPHHLHRHTGIPMIRGIFSGRLLGLLDVFGAVAGSSSAVRNHRTPDPRDLHRLGIDPERYREINRF
jgi:hypothetical protein